MLKTTTFENMFSRAAASATGMSFISAAPSQYMTRASAFMHSPIIGWMTAMRRWFFSWVFIISVLGLSNFAFW